MDIVIWFMDIILRHIGAGAACNLSSTTAGGAVKENGLTRFVNTDPSNGKQDHTVNVFWCFNE